MEPKDIECPKCGWGGAIDAVDIDMGEYHCPQCGHYWYEIRVDCPTCGKEIPHRADGPGPTHWFCDGCGQANWPADYPPDEGCPICDPDLR